MYKKQLKYGYGWPHPSQPGMINPFAGYGQAQPWSTYTSYRQRKHHYQQNDVEPDEIYQANALHLEEAENGKLKGKKSKKHKHGRTALHEDVEDGYQLSSFSDESDDPTFDMTPKQKRKYLKKLAKKRKQQEEEDEEEKALEEKKLEEQKQK